MSDEPGWMNSANDRKTPYTEDELEEFVEGGILGLDQDEWLDLKTKYGEHAAREVIKSGFIAGDDKNLIYFEPNDEVH